ncbi:AmmeMemoRadiSam system protein A [Catenovulum sp. 2E275]|uniref:AmmeMemoRadiSam system protein A n=1 Tax=Catenovulum sp. 2E275 TaxID=2980497 RepID=UPI0021D2C585|nr:AmmeMemoRadiSam system protein A [Catenovulum sp. 2E275]MCU4674420.1 AmmeMemoRadiSam system protein A [Catenovulum sp. 2E275]
MPLSVFEQTDVKQHILSVVTDSLAYAFENNGNRLPEHLIPKHPLLAEPLACFVSLSAKSVLRGCVGTTFTTERLDTNIAWYTHEAAFHDPRFDPIDSKELTQLSTAVSVMTKPLPLAVTSENDLLEQLIPFKDGLMIQYGQLSGIFLPCQWQSYPQPDEFLYQLKLKAGWPDHGWTKAMKAWVFQTYKVEGDLNLKQLMV